MYVLPINFYIMPYVKVSIPKNGDGAGCADPKSSEIIVIDVEDIVTEPTREVGNVELVGDITLKEGAEAVAIYATSPTIECTEETSGDVDARGVMQGVAFDHPGDSKDIKNFTEAFMNKGVVILTRSCDGTAKGRHVYYGNKCNPLFLTTERTDTKEANKRKFTFKQEIAGKFLPGEYSGELPAIAKTSAELAADDTEEGA